MRLEWSAYATEDRLVIFDYIGAENPRAAVRVDERIGSQLAHLISHPESVRSGRVAGTRELVIDRTPYIAAYRVTADAVRILRCCTARSSGLTTCPGSALPADAACHTGGYASRLSLPEPPP